MNQETQNKNKISTYNLILVTNILRILREKKMTKKELVRKAGISTAFFSHLTNNRVNPSLRMIESIAIALNTPLPLLFDSSDMSNVERALVAKNNKDNLAEGFVWKGAILTEFQAFEVGEWDAENREIIAKNKEY